MGSDKNYPEEAPAHEVTVDGFWMDQHAVTNEEFAASSKRPSTSRSPNARRIPTIIPPPNRKCSCLRRSFFKNPNNVNLNDCYQWWTYVPGANWRHHKTKRKRQAIKIALRRAACLR